MEVVSSHQLLIRRKVRLKTHLKYIYNHKENTCCGRKPISWLTVILFFTISIGLMFLLFRLIFLLLIEFVIPVDEPWFNKKDLIDEYSPALNIYPVIGSLLSPVIWYKRKKVSEKDKIPLDYVDSINNLFKSYDEAEANIEQYSLCTDKRANKPCFFNTSDLGPCSDDSYGYFVDKPCIYLRLNKLQGWKPRQYEDWKHIPPSMPQFIANKVLNGSASDKKLIWVECHGSYPSDREHLGNFTYYPQQGFPFHYFPFNNEKNYLPPMIAVQFSEVKAGYIIFITCTIWAENIDYTKPYRFLYELVMYIH